jgi:hypothetical protein
MGIGIEMLQRSNELGVIALRHAWYWCIHDGMLTVNAIDRAMTEAELGQDNVP